jgi:hypothetical protein
VREGVSTCARPFDDRATVAITNTVWNERLIILPWVSSLGLRLTPKFSRSESNKSAGEFRAIIKSLVSFSVH